MRIAAIVLFVAITVLSIDFRMIAEVIAACDVLRANLNKRADRVAGFVPFLEGVRARTRNGDSIALIVSAPNVGLYRYGFFRASYILAGRSVVPMVDERGAFRTAAVRQARYLAIFRLQYAGAGSVVWRSEAGELVRQR
jgi:hypothetical protein